MFGEKKKKKKKKRKKERKKYEYSTCLIPGIYENSSCAFCDPSSDRNALTFCRIRSCVYATSRENKHILLCSFHGHFRHDTKDKSLSLSLLHIYINISQTFYIEIRFEFPIRGHSVLSQRYRENFFFPPILNIKTYSCNA